MKKKILVLGSRHDSIVPNLEFDEVYVANSAAINALKYKKKFPHIKIICCSAGLVFDKNPICRNSILDLDPDEIHFRSFPTRNIDLKKTKINILTKKEQRKMQYSFFKLNMLSLIIAESKYRKKNLRETFKYFYESLIRNSFLGTSTGLFSVLLALNKHKNNCDIFISGIGFDGGAYFFSNLEDHVGRHLVDKYIIQNALKSKFKKNITTFDMDTSVLAGIRHQKIDVSDTIL
tara:strand:+ start:653 stop:1351 length:699 start_codon:yes stop_codon:yes gene_type:complete